MMFLFWCSYGIPMVFLWCSYVTSLTENGVSVPAVQVMFIHYTTYTALDQILVYIKYVCVAFVCFILLCLVYFTYILN